MNKYIAIGLVVIVGIGIGYNVFLVKQKDRPIETPTTAPSTSVSGSPNETSVLATASVKARELGYNPDRLFAKLDVDNERWKTYHASLGNPLQKDPAFAFLQQDKYLSVYYSATTNVTTPYLWIFVDAETGEVVHYYEP